MNIGDNNINLIKNTVQELFARTESLQAVFVLDDKKERLAEINAELDIPGIWDDTQRAEKYFRQLANASPVMTLSSRKQQGMEQWLNWLKYELQKHRKQVSQHSHSHSHHSHSHHHHHAT